VIFYFFAGYFIEGGKSYFLMDGFDAGRLVLAVVSITLLDFLRLDLAFADSLVWLLLIFFIYFFMVSLGISM
jgi:hypothetical protein